VETSLAPHDEARSSHWLARLVGAVGALIIAGLLRLFGRVVRLEDAPWLDGPVGGEHIGDRPYAELAAREGLRIARDVRDAGLLPRFDALSGPGFDPSQVDARIRAFYENTSRYELDVQTRTFFPLNVGLWLLVTTLSRKVDQMNFPLRALEGASGVTSELVLLRDVRGETRHTGWTRRVGRSGRVIYTGFYSVAQIPGCKSPVVKTVFPMPHGNATVLLQPLNHEAGELQLISQGSRFGEPGFYRVDRLGEGTLRVWRVRSLVERLRLYVDQGEVRCDHEVRFWGLPVLALHYRLRLAVP
jgi:hypothetical protein